MKSIKQSKLRKWRPLSGMLLVLLMSFVPHGAQAKYSLVDGTGFFWDYFIKNLTYDEKNYTITFTSQYCHQYMASFDEGFYQQNGFTFYARRDGDKYSDKGWTKLGSIKISPGTHDVELFDNTAEFSLTGTAETLHEGLTAASERPYGYNYIRKFKWVLPVEWRNCNIHFMGKGTWTDKDGSSDPHEINSLKDGHERPISTPYSLVVRKMQWDGDFSIAPDGTVTVPYKFESTARNTDGYTFVHTSIGGNYNGKCSNIKPASNYSAGTYSFKLSAISKSFRSDNFTIEPYHEFKHDHDMANNNGVKYYTQAAGSKEFLKFPKAINVNASFNKVNNHVLVKWQSDNNNYFSEDNTKWAIYRDGEYLAHVQQKVTNNSNYDSDSQLYTFIDDNCPHKEAVEYEIYYIWKDWNVKTAQVAELKSDSSVVSTVLTVPIDNLSAASEDDRIVFTWNTDAHQADWGHEFRIFVDDETTPIATIKPASDDQSSFAWIHRTTDQHAERQSGVENGIPYTEEPLNACEPHDYRVESWFGNEKMDSVTLTGRAIGTGTLFYSADATKGVYPGLVKLNWHVNLQGSTDAKTYIIERRTAEHESEPWETISTLTSREERLNYTDDTPLPGVYYDYRVTVQDRCDENTTITNDTTIIGFAQTTGTVSGRITFGSAGNAVAGVDVIAKRVGASASGDEDQYHAMRFTGTNGAVSWTYPDSTYVQKKFTTSDFSMQMWICPDEFNDVSFARLQGDNVGLGMSNGELLFCDGKQNYNFGIFLKKGRYNHVTLTRKGTTLTCYLTDLDEDGNPTVQSATQPLTGDFDFTVVPSLSTFTLGYFNGYVDEFRLWTKCLTKDEILENFDHLLVGNEKDLETYWTFDEGLKGQFFDSSRSGTAYHNHHGKTGSNTEPDKFTPTALKLKAKTDLDGNYIIQGVPFSGEGTTYAVIPQLGIHEFNPTQQLRFVSNNSLVHNATDFTDVSSFPVSGTIFYSGTDYPVEGVNFYVDGTVCSKNGELVETDSEGRFTISVPIGRHFIEARKNGHVFVNDGRYPPDPNLTDSLFNFERAITGLEFRDTTLVNFTGRVVGGDIEGEKPIGFALSTNNIGKTTITLVAPNSDKYRMNVVKETTNGTTYSLETNLNRVPIASASDTIKSNSWRGAGVNDCSKLFIRTDSVTGEFSAMVPPLTYTIQSINVDATGQDIIENPFTVDLTQTLIENKDSIENENGSYDYYYYNTLLRQTYHSVPTFTVKQEGRTDGSFGISEYTIKDAQGELKIEDICKDGNYKFGAPIFVGSDSYIFNIEGYELYVNKDTGKDVEAKVPLAGTVVTIANALSSEQLVYGTDNQVGAEPGSTDGVKDFQLKLNDNGEATYMWKAGLPNISDPYTRTINIYYNIGDVSYDWTGNSMNGIVLGDLPTGNNFVTAGTDYLDMILRDPPGSTSSAEWSSGSVWSKSELKGGTWSSETTGKTTSHFGPNVQIAKGVPGLYEVTNLQAKYNVEAGVKVTCEGENTTTWNREVSTIKTISTSDSPDFVGADGDVFIGSSTNLIFGVSRCLGFVRDENNPNNAVLSVDDAVTTGLEFDTEFSYTQSYIKNVLIPNFVKIRNSKLEYVPSLEGFTNNEKRVRYMTTLPSTDPKFGSSNHDKDVWGALAETAPSSSGHSYIMYKPLGAKDEDSYTDSVEWCNSQIKVWETYLMVNEMEKVLLYKYRHEDTQNYSFDAGTKVNRSVETSTSNGYHYDVTTTAVVLGGFQTGFAVNNVGIEFEVSTETGAGEHHEIEESNEEKTSFGFTLSEDGTDDALSVDVYESICHWGPVFRTRGGQTSAPYEGAVYTEYYKENGDSILIMEGTMKVEVPQIDVDNPVMNSVPTGSAAEYTLRLSNNSEVGADVAYKLFVLDETNPDGAQLSIDGKVLTEGRLIKVPGNQTITKTLQLRQTNISVLDYKNIGIVFASNSEAENIADTIFISANFVPSSSPVTLALKNTTMNTQTGDTLTLTFKDFDRNYRGLKAFRLQYKKQGATDWTMFHEYVLDDKNMSANSELMPTTGGSVSYNLPMSSFSDGDYLFRVVSVSEYGTGEVTRESNEMTLVKDMQKPRPMGQPEPSDGILDIGDDLSVTFNETFLKGELTKAKNFLVTGVLNGAEIAHETALTVSSGSLAAPAATTETGINLADKDFSIDTWVNIVGPGTLLSHGQGNNKLTIGTDSDSKLVVTIANDSCTSTNSVPTGKWAFLTMNVTADGKLSATVASADETVSLFDNKEVPAYVGNGPLSVGCGASAAMHELLLWDEAHDLTTALANRSVTKNPATRHLIGYWKMDEGEGKSIRDYARSRNMTMPNETWYLNNENKAVTLDGSHYVSINATTLPITEYDDYAVEFWMRGSQQTAEAQLLQMGDVALWLNADGQLKLTGKGASKPADQQTSNLNAQTSNLLDNAWHHIALNVLRQGAAAVYVDGKRCLTTNATNVGAINTDRLIIGIQRLYKPELGGVAPYTYGKAFKGEIDEVRVWGATMNGDQLTKNRKVRFTGTEPGLVAYYPFETKTLDEYNQIVTIGTPADLTGSGLQAQTVALSGSPDEALAYTDEAPALRTKPTETNVNFNFVASDEKIVIEIDEDPATIEGCTLNFNVRDVRDVNGNYSAPAVWSAFINKKELVWADDALSVTLPVETSSSVTATIVNKGGKQQMWTLDGLPSWLTASADYGTTNPKSESTVTFTVSPSTPIGKYEETIYLKGNDGIETPLTISVKVTGEEPLWSVNAPDYEETMNIIGNLFVLGQMSEDEDDLVGAFINGECRGVARPQYNKRYDSYFVTMNIYGSANDIDENDKTPLPIEFKAYDASTGIIYPVVKSYLDGNATAETIRFISNDLKGRYATPVKFSTTDEMEQNIEFAKGWNWMSLGVKPDVFTVETVFSKADRKVSFLKNQANSAEFDGEIWLDNIKQMNNSEMYAVQTNDILTLSVTGHKVDSSKEDIPVVDGWSWVGFNSLSVMDLSEALAGMEPQDDELIKSQRGVAYYDSYEWIGSLKQLTPGLGYKIKGKKVRTFTYPTKTMSTAGARRDNAIVNVERVATAFTPVDYHSYPANMVLIAQVVADGQPVEGVELGVFAGDECREAALSDERGMIIITIPGDELCELTFRVSDGTGIRQMSTSITYETDTVVGLPKAPFIIDLAQATGINEISSSLSNSTIYDMQGRKVRVDDRTRKLRKGVYIVNGQKEVK